MISTPCGSTRPIPSADPRRRPGRSGHARRRQDLEQLVQPADRADLSRQHGQSLPVLGLWRRSRTPARWPCRAAPRDRRRHHHGAVPRDHRGRRERHDRAGPGRPGHRLRRRPDSRASSKLGPQEHRRATSIPRSRTRAIHYRSAWTLPLAFSKRGRKTLYFANQRLFSTADGGEHWRRSARI